VISWTGTESRLLPAKLFLHGVDEVVRHERFAVVFADVPVRGRAGLGAQVTGELAAVIILDDDDPLALRKNTRHHVGVERHNPLDVQLIRHNALLAGELFDRFANDPFVEPQPTSVTWAFSGPTSLAEQWRARAVCNLRARFSTICWRLRGLVNSSLMSVPSSSCSSVAAT